MLGVKMQDISILLLLMVRIHEYPIYHDLSLSLDMLGVRQFDISHLNPEAILFSRIK